MKAHSWIAVKGHEASVMCQIWYYKPSYDPILGVRGVAGTEENFGGYYVEVSM